MIGFDWTETPLEKARIEQLATANFMELAHNLILVGGTGTGKTHLASALAVSAIHQGKRIRFYNAVDLVNQLEKEKQRGKAGSLGKRLSQIDTHRAQVPSLLMSWATCPFPNPVAPCSSTSLANGMRKHR